MSWPWYGWRCWWFRFRLQWRTVVDVCTLIRGVDGALFDTVVSLGVMVVAAELLGLVGALRFGWLTGLLWVLAGTSFWVTRTVRTGRKRDARA